MEPPAVDKAGENAPKSPKGEISESAPESCETIARVLRRAYDVFTSLFSCGRLVVAAGDGSFLDRGHSRRRTTGLEVHTLFLVTTYVEAMLGLLLLFAWVQNWRCAPWPGGASPM